MLATRMFFWWDTAFVDPMKPVVVLPATTRVWVVKAKGSGR